MSVVIARNLFKRYGPVEAVRGISFDLQPGECYGLLGPNGAGKTTTMSMIRCVAPPSAGQLKVLGMDVRIHGRQIRHRLGVVPQHDSLDTDLTVRNNLIVYARYFGLSPAEANRRADELLAFMALQEKAQVKIDELSGGLRRRLLIARGLINSPELLILDEPTTGLDPQARHHIWQKLRSLSSEGKPMILCTHSMDEAEQLCSRLCIIDRGKILAEGTPVELIARHAGGEALELRDLDRAPPEAVDELLRHSMPTGVRCERQEDALFCFSPAGTSFPPEFLEKARTQRLSLTVRRASLEDVFLNLTGRELRE